MSLFFSSTIDQAHRQLREIQAQLQAAMAGSKKVITREEWEKKLSDVKIKKEDMNKLVMNFLVTEGYVDAAEKFRKESGTERLLDGIKEVFPSSPHSYCIKHLKDNLFGKLSKKLPASYASYRDTLVSSFAACAYARTLEKFDEAMQKLRSDGKGVVEDFLKELKLENYAFAHFPGKRYGAMSNSQAESYSNMIKDERCMPLPQLLEGVRVHTMDLFTRRRLDTSNWGCILCPKMEKLLKRLQTGRNWRVSQSSQDVFEVFTETCNIMVNLAGCECSCGHWEFRCFPCAHAVQVMNKANLFAYDYIEDYILQENI